MFPHCAAWETGNELGGYMLGGGAPPASWTKDIAAYIKNIAPNHLVADGTDGLSDYGGSLANTGVGVPNVDLVCVASYLVSLIECGHSS